MSRHYFPGLHWPAQVELRAGRHVVRPRYEVVRGGRTRIAHINVERGDLKPDAGHQDAACVDGARVSAAVSGAAAQPLQDDRAADADGDVRAEHAAAAGCVRRRMATKLLERFLGVLPRRHDVALDLDDVLEADALPDGGHAELVYDFREGGEANGWLHALFRFEDRAERPCGGEQLRRAYLQYDHDL